MIVRHKRLLDPLCFMIIYKIKEPVPVSYDTDVHKAMDVIRDCVMATPYALGVDANGIREDSGPVCFLK